MRSLRTAFETGEVDLVSMGWSGAPWHLLEDDELEWETAWSMANHIDTGSQQLWRVAPRAFFPVGGCAAQLRRTAVRTGKMVIGGAGSYYLFSPSGASAMPPVALTAVTLIPGSLSHGRVAPPTNHPHAASESMETFGIVHVVFENGERCAEESWKILTDGWFAERTTIAFGELPDFADGASPDGAHAAGTHAGVHADCAHSNRVQPAGNRPDGAATPWTFTVPALARRFERADLAAYHRRRPVPQRERVTAVLEALALGPVSRAAVPTPVRTRATVQHVPGSAQGRMSLTEGPLHVVFMGGRPAQVQHDGATVLPLQRIQAPLITARAGYFGETVAAATFEAHRLRGVFEQTRHQAPGLPAIDTTLRSIVVADVPVLYQLLEFTVPVEWAEMEPRRWSPYDVVLARGEELSTQVLCHSPCWKDDPSEIFALPMDGSPAVAPGALLHVESTATARGTAAPSCSAWIGAWSQYGSLIWPFELHTVRDSTTSELHAHPLWCLRNERVADLAGIRTRFLFSLSGLKPPAELPDALRAFLDQATSSFCWIR